MLPLVAPYAWLSLSPCCQTDNQLPISAPIGSHEKGGSFGYKNAMINSKKGEEDLVREESKK